MSSFTASYRWKELDSPDFSRSGLESRDFKTLTEARSWLRGKRTSKRMEISARQIYDRYGQPRDLS